LSECHRCISLSVTYGTCSPPKMDDSFFYGPPYAKFRRTGGTAEGVEVSSSGTVCIVGDPCNVKPGTVGVEATDYSGHTATTSVSVSVDQSACEACTGCNPNGEPGPGSGNDTISATPTFMGSAAALVKLGRGAFGKKLGSLVIQETVQMYVHC